MDDDYGTDVFLDAMEENQQNDPRGEPAFSLSQIKECHAILTLLQKLEWIDGFCPSCSGAETMDRLILERRSGWGGTTVGHKADCILAEILNL